MALKKVFIKSPVNPQLKHDNIQLNVLQCIKHSCAYKNSSIEVKIGAKTSKKF